VIAGGTMTMNEMTAQVQPMTINRTAQAGERPAGLKRRSVILMIVLMLLTAGLYYPFWFLRRRAALNRLDAPTKLSQWPLILILVGVGIHTFATLASGSSTPVRVFGPAAALVIQVIWFATLVLAVVQCFFIKQILEDHLSGPDSEGPITKQPVKLSILMTLLFTILYLQYVINRDVVGPARAS
jgi:hypothetical protein